MQEQACLSIHAPGFRPRISGRVLEVPGALCSNSGSWRRAAFVKGRSLKQEAGVRSALAGGFLGVPSRLRARATAPGTEVDAGAKVQQGELRVQSFTTFFAEGVVQGLQSRGLRGCHAGLSEFQAEEWKTVSHRVFASSHLALPGPGRASEQATRRFLHSLFHHELMCEDSPRPCIYIAVHGNAA